MISAMTPYSKFVSSVPWRGYAFLLRKRFHKPCARAFRFRSSTMLGTIFHLVAGSWLICDSYKVSAGIHSFLRNNVSGLYKRKDESTYDDEMSDLGESVFGEG